MRLIQPLKFRTLKTGCFKMPHLQKAVFQMEVTIASGLGKVLGKIGGFQKNMKIWARAELNFFRCAQYEVKKFQ